MKGGDPGVFVVRIHCGRSVLLSMLFLSTTTIAITIISVVVIGPFELFSFFLLFSMFFVS